jgi:hypothetical protein
MSLAANWAQMSNSLHLTFIIRAKGIDKRKFIDYLKVDFPKSRRLRVRSAADAGFFRGHTVRDMKLTHSATVRPASWPSKGQQP